MDKYAVVIGNDTFTPIEAGDSQAARYVAAGLFKEKYHLECPLTPIAELAKARLLRELPKPAVSTKEILSKLKNYDKKELKLGQRGLSKKGLPKR